MQHDASENEDLSLVKGFVDARTRKPSRGWGVMVRTSDIKDHHLSEIDLIVKSWQFLLNKTYKNVIDCHKYSTFNLVRA